ncbi:MAG TPA: GNAT family N-acetyltransferase [Ktedonobacteraceae bacterium]
MLFPHIIQSPGGELSIAPATRPDLLPLLKLFDETVTWLNARGLGNQWGSELFSTSLDRHRQFLNWINLGIFFTARLQGQVVGSLTLSPAPPWYIAKRWQTFPMSAFYLEAFTTSRSLAGLGLGRTLLQWSERYTLVSNKTTIWLDCWADNPALVHYYLQAGYTPHEIFLVHAWRGQLFEKRLATPQTNRRH